MSSGLHSCFASRLLTRALHVIGCPWLDSLEVHSTAGARSSSSFKSTSAINHLEVILLVGWTSEILPLRCAPCSFGVFLFSICTFLFVSFSWTTRIQAFGPNTVSSSSFLNLRRSSLYPLLCFLQDSSTKSLSSRLDE